MLFSQTLRHKNGISIYMYSRVESKNNFLTSSPIKRAQRMCYSEILYEEPTCIVSICIYILKSVLGNANFNVSYLSL